MSDDDRLFIPKELRLKIEKITAQSRVTAENLRLSSWQDLELDALVIQCVRKVCFIEATPCVQYPRTWWDAFKERWFPAWALKRWPVQYRVLEARTYFPDLMIPRQGDQQVLHYFSFMEIHRGKDQP